MSQISRSPNVPFFVEKAIVDPSGEIADAQALSRSFRGSPPRTETIQILVPSEENTSGLSPAGCALTRNLVLSGSHADQGNSHSGLTSSSAFGSGTTWVSPVSSNLI